MDKEKREESGEVAKAISDGFSKLGDKFDALAKRVDELESAAKSSKQNDNVTKADDIEGVL